MDEISITNDSKIMQNDYVKLENETSAANIKIR